MPGVRHLTLAQAIAALNRAKQVEQLLAVDDLAHGTRVVRWLTAYPRDLSFVLAFHEVEDIGAGELCDPSEFPPLDGQEPLGEGKIVAESDNPESLLGLARGHGGKTDRWVNQGVIDDEYFDARQRLSK